MGKIAPPPPPPGYCQDEWPPFQVLLMKRETTNGVTNSAPFQFKAWSLGVVAVVDAMHTKNEQQDPICHRSCLKQTPVVTNSMAAVT